jgi:hypothetical protein
MRGLSKSRRSRWNLGYLNHCVCYVKTVINQVSDAFLGVALFVVCSVVILSLA